MQTKKNSALNVIVCQDQLHLSFLSIWRVPKKSWGGIGALTSFICFFLSLLTVRALAANSYCIFLFCLLQESGQGYPVHEEEKKGTELDCKNRNPCQPIWMLSFLTADFFLKRTKRYLHLYAAEIQKKRKEKRKVHHWIFVETEKLHVSHIFIWKRISFIWKIRCLSFECEPYWWHTLVETTYNLHNDLEVTTMKYSS